MGDILFISYVLNPLNSDVENECNKPTALGVGTFLLLTCFKSDYDRFRNCFLQKVQRDILYM